MKHYSILFSSFKKILLAEKGDIFAATVNFWPKWDDKFGPVWSHRPDQSKAK